MNWLLGLVSCEPRERALAAVLVVGAFIARWPSTPSPSASRWHENYFPNVVLTTQDGKKVRFYDDVLQGKVVSLNFIYTNCGDVCPLDTAQLRQVHALLGDRVGKDVFTSIRSRSIPSTTRRHA